MSPATRTKAKTNLDATVNLLDGDADGQEEELWMLRAFGAQ